MREEYVGIAKRENNTKRNYLVVNKLQGKHVPVSPTQALEMFNKLAVQVKVSYEGEKILVIGFAETATAIGAQVAVVLDAYYMQTTREIIEDVDYLYFSEAHSHATEQKLVRKDIDKVMDDIERIVFVEDEVTTGNTILNIIGVLENKYTKNFKFSVATLLNGMNEQSTAVYDKKNIDVHYLLKMDNDSFTAVANAYKGDGVYYSAENSKNQHMTSVLWCRDYINPRRLTSGGMYDRACQSLWEQVRDALPIMIDENILVLGSEELMYPSLYVGKKLEDAKCRVRCHATTRSPIAVSSEEMYPLHTRFELTSLYEDERITYIYELAKYDRVLIVTDATDRQQKGLETLVEALTRCGNTTIQLIRWC